jgi:hypothetical protein
MCVNHPRFDRQEGMEKSTGAKVEVKNSIDIYLDRAKHGVLFCRVDNLCQQLI